jgi:GAF domain-containing protein
MRQRGGSEQPVKSRRANKPRARAIAAPSIADLQRQVGALSRELQEALERQSATAEVLQVINSSPGNLAPVFDAILEKAHSLCAVAHGALLLYDGEKFRAFAVRGLSEAFAAHLRQGVVVSPNLPHHRLLEGARFAQVPDWTEIDDPFARGAVDTGMRTTLYIPLRWAGKLLGYFTAARPEVRPFSETEIALLESFAAQAVIAIENARLFEAEQQRRRELAESLEQQTATSEVLQVISSSPGDLQPVFEAMLEKAVRICDAKFGNIYRWDGELMHLLAAHNTPPALAEVRRQSAFRPSSVVQRMVETKTAAQVLDLAADKSYTDEHPASVTAVERGGVRTLLSVPLVKKTELIGSFSLYRQEVRPFTDKQIELVENFSKQAVIAIENARLFNELRQRTDDLAESLE